MHWLICYLVVSKKELLTADNFRINTISWKINDTLFMPLNNFLVGDPIFYANEKGSFFPLETERTQRKV